MKTGEIESNLVNLNEDPLMSECLIYYIKEGTTKRITNTPEQERSLSFHPDGNAILYAGERDGSWNVYQTKIKREEEKYFFNSTLF